MKTGVSTLGKRALIIGVDGQDGFYLTKFLLSRDYEVFGIVRKKSVYHQDVDDLKMSKCYHQIFADLTDFSSIMNAVSEAEPDEIYNFAGQSEIPISWRQPSLTAEVNALGVVRILETIRIINPQIKFFQASSSEMFGRNRNNPLDETSEFLPRNPYGTAKLFAHWSVENYRRQYGLFACSGILFNHESPRRGHEFVTRKITSAAAAISGGKQDLLELGDIYAVRDWGYAGDYVRAMWLMLQQDTPDDYVIATGKGRTVKDFVVTAFKAVGMPLYWEGNGMEETARDERTGKLVVRINPVFYRHIENDRLVGNPRKAETVLGFYPERSFEDMVSEIVKRDVFLLSEKKV